MKDFFTIIGGMGTAATESFVRLLNARTPAVKDQEYLNYLLVNHASIPDRTDYILDHQKPSFYPDLLEDIQQQSLLQPAFMAIICNTAHYFYEQLQQQTAIPLLHMPRNAVSYLQQHYPQAQKVGLIATQGTLADQVYQQELQQQGLDYTLGDKQLQADVMTLIYDCIKEQGTVDAQLYHQILQRMVHDFGADVVILGCTELSLAQEKAPQHNYPVVDAQSIMVDICINLGQKLQQGLPVMIQDGVAQY